MMHALTLQTDVHDQFIDITSRIQDLIQQHSWRDGAILVYCPHTTAGIAINENADPDVVRDVLRRLDEVYPWNHAKDRHAEGNTAAHLKAITTGTSQYVLVHNGRLQLGTWQGIYFCEFDGPRTRKVWVRFFNGE